MNIQKIFFAVLLFIPLMFGSCYGNFDPIDENKSLTMVPNYTIDSLVKTFVSPIGDLPARIPGLFSVDTLPSNKDIIISGIVTSDDNEGNIYKNMIIRDPKTGTAMKLSVDAGNLSAVFPLGQKVVMNCKGLAIGRYADMLQRGVSFYKTESGKVGYEIGRIPYTLFVKIIQGGVISKDTLSKMVDTVTIAQIKAGGLKMHSKLVCIKNAKFTGKGANFGKPEALTHDSLRIFAPSTNGIGFPQSREIIDGTGSMFIATSEYSKFAKLKLPADTTIGNITAIVGWYNDKDLTLDGSKIYHQLTLRMIGDLGKGFEKYHNSIKK
jgi:hypothetical protein